LHTITGCIITDGAAADSAGSSSVQLSQQHDVHATLPLSTAGAGLTTAAVQAASSVKDEEYNIIGYEIAVNEAQRKEDESHETLKNYREEELFERLEHEAPFNLSFYDKSRCFNHEALVQLFAAVTVLPEFSVDTVYAEKTSWETVQ
jgi:hypothetical protein